MVVPLAMVPPSGECLRGERRVWWLCRVKAVDHTWALLQWGSRRGAIQMFGLYLFLPFETADTEHLTNVCIIIHRLPQGPGREDITKW